MLKETTFEHVYLSCPNRGLNEWLRSVEIFDLLLRAFMSSFCPMQNFNMACCIRLEFDGMALKASNGVPLNASNWLILKKLLDVIKSCSASLSFVLTSDR